MAIIVSLLQGCKLKSEKKSENSNLLQTGSCAVHSLKRHLHKCPQDGAGYQLNVPDSQTLYYILSTRYQPTLCRHSQSTYLPYLNMFPPLSYAVGEWNKSGILANPKPVFIQCCYYHQTIFCQSEESLQKICRLGESTAGWVRVFLSMGMAPDWQMRPYMVLPHVGWVGFWILDLFQWVLGF